MAEPTTITDFDPSTTSAIYDEMQDSWLLNRDMAEMHLHILRDGTYLDEFGGNTGGKTSESAPQLDWRQKASFAMDHCADLINLRVDNIFRVPPARHYEDSPYRDFIDRFLADVDGGGTSMETFMRRALPRYYTNGVEFVVDKQATPDGVELANRAQEDELGLMPYVHAFGPLERLDWATDHAGRYLWARYDMGDLAAVDEWADATDARKYLTITDVDWRLYTKDGEGVTTMVVGKHPIASGVPIVPFFYKESARPDYPKVPLSLLTRIAPIARYLLNLLSQIQIDVYRNIAFLVATGVDAEKIPKAITPMGCWALPEGAELKDVAGDVNHIKVKIELAQLLMEVILRMGRLTGGTGDLKSRAASGVQVAVERTDLDNEMKATAVQMGEVDGEIVRIAASRFTGKEIRRDDLGYSAEYNQKYILTSPGELIREMREFVGTDVHGQVPGMLQIMLRRLLDALARDDDPSYEAVVAQIEGLQAEAALVPDLGNPAPDDGSQQVEEPELE